MPFLSARKHGFVVHELYHIRRQSFVSAARTKISFLIAALSLFAFAIGNMVGQHGLYAFYRIALGKEEVIVFTGTVSPIALVPDYQKWSQYGGNVRDHTYRQVPSQFLVPLPPYDAIKLRQGTADAFTQRVYSVGHLGDYASGRDNAGSHVGTDISAPVGTPALSIANGEVEKVAFQPNGYGNYIVIRHPNVPDPSGSKELTTIWSIYAHLDTVLVQEGQIVAKGQQIATTGQTGFASGPHLHFQIDNKDAPYHPYWPFTGEEQRSAGYTFVQAINAGLHQERGAEYTVSPMLYVQAHQNDTPVIASTQQASRTLARVTPSRDQRIASRLARHAAATVSSKSSVPSIAIAAADPTLLALASQSSESSSVASSVSSSVASIASSMPSTEVATLQFAHSGLVQRQWQTVQIQALDRDGRIVSMPKFSGRIYLRATFGDAEFRPSELTSLDFIKGVATVQVLTRGTKTTILSARGAFNTDSSPLVSVR